MFRWNYEELYFMDNMTTLKTLFVNNVIKPIIEMCFIGEMRVETKYSFAIKKSKYTQEEPIKNIAIY